jgi:hypothetical protein
MENHGDFKPEPLGSVQKSNRPIGAAEAYVSCSNKGFYLAVHDLPRSCCSASYHSNIMDLSNSLSLSFTPDGEEG